MQEIDQRCKLFKISAQKVFGMFWKGPSPKPLALVNSTAANKQKSAELDKH